MELPVLVLGIWATAFTACVPALIAWQARRRETEESIGQGSLDRGTED